MNLNKDIEQKKALNLWWKNGAKGTIEAATAFGKCRLGVMASAHIFNLNPKCKILIVVPTTVIKDDWLAEFKKWMCNHIIRGGHIDIQCINTARDYKKNHYDLIILDEIHNYLQGIENGKVYKNNSYDRILGLSATIDNSLVQEINKIAPICYSMDLNTAVELGLVSGYTVLNIGIDLTSEEKKLYDAYTVKIDYAYQMHGVRSWKNISARKELLYHATNKIKIIEKLVSLFDNDYGIIFSMTKDYADEVHKIFEDSSIPHHSGISKKNRIINLKKFSDGRTKIKLISSAKTVDEGVTLPRVKFAIILAGSSKPRQSIQRVGRVIRLADDKDKAYIIRVYVKDSKEEQWVSNSQSKLKCINLSSIDELKNYLK